MALKIVKVAILVVSATDLANGENCNSSRNSDILERAFGQVINSRLENQTIIMLDQMQEQDTFLQMQNEKLDFMMKALLDNQNIIIRKQNDACIEIVDEKLQEQSQYFEKIFNEQNETYERNLEELKSTSKGDCEELLDAKLQEQSDYFQENFKKQNETYKEKLFANLLEQRESFEEFKELDETLKQSLKEFESLEERYRTVLQELIQLAMQQNNESEWVRIMNSDIWLSSKEANFDEAIEICDGMDAKLYEPQSFLHNQLVYLLIKAKERDEHGYFIGIHDKYEEGSFVYQSTNDSIAFEHWGSFSHAKGPLPNNANGGQHCVHFVSSTDKNWEGPPDAWNDLECDWKRFFICEK